MAFNKILNDDWMNNTLEDKSVELIIADPPYFEVKGDFDFAWESFDDYLKDVERWAIECKRILADNGTLFWYGDRKKIAHSQVILDKYFVLENSIYLQSATNSMTEQWDTLRSFYEVGFERLLMYSNGEDEKWWELLYHETMRKAVNNVQVYLNTITSVNEFAEILLKNGNCKNYDSAKQNASNILSQKSHKPQMITEIQYSWIDKPKAPYSDLKDLFKKAYDFNNELRMKQEHKRRYFNNYLKLQDRWYFTKGNANNFEHETVKSEDQTRAIILTCSRPGDLVFVPFAGSGTECAMAAKEGRKFLGYDINKTHSYNANKRCENFLNQPSLFNV